MFTSKQGIRRAVTGTVAGVIVAGALAGPAMASDGGDSVRKAGDKPLEYMKVTDTSKRPPDLPGMRKAGGDPTALIIVVC